MIHPGRCNPNQGSGSFRSGRALPCPPLSWNPCAGQLSGCFSVLASGLAFINKHSLAQNAPPPPGLQMSVEVFMNRYTLPHLIPSPGLLCSCPFPVSCWQTGSFWRPARMSLLRVPFPHSLSCWLTFNGHCFPCPSEDPCHSIF